jgi:hypothetical protein
MGRISKMHYICYYTVGSWTVLRRAVKQNRTCKCSETWDAYIDRNASYNILTYWGRLSWNRAPTMQFDVVRHSYRGRSLRTSSALGRWVSSGSAILVARSKSCNAAGWTLGLFRALLNHRVMSGIRVRCAWSGPGHLGSATFLARQNSSWDSSIIKIMIRKNVHLRGKN